MKIFEPAQARSCHLVVAPAGTFTSLAAAWASLPQAGEGWLTLAGELVRFPLASPVSPDAFLLEAEIARSPSETFSLRHEDGVWKTWIWREEHGDGHKAVDERFISSFESPREIPPPRQRYTTYWELAADELGVKVWRPLGARFRGWED